MKIIINGRFLLHRTTGVERYAREILSELDKLCDKSNIEIAMAVPQEAEDSAIPQYQNIKVTKVGKLHNRMWEHISFPRYVKKQKAISLNLCNVAPLSHPDIVCMHDAKPKATPQYYSLGFRLWYGIIFGNQAKRAKKIITVSEFSKNELVKYYHINPDKIVVIPNGWQHFERARINEEALSKYGLEKGNYIFTMSSREPNKNFGWIVRAAKKNTEEIFVVAGGINTLIFKNEDIEIPSNIRILGYVPDEDAKALMKNCKAFTFVTFYEGFGIPPLEALSVGAKQVVVSDTDVMHEIFGKNGEVCFADPNGSGEELEVISYVSEDLRNTILEKYSWKESAEKLYKILQ